MARETKMGRSERAMQPKFILFITTADTDILTAESALSGLPEGFPRVAAVNPASLPSDSDSEPGATEQGNNGVR